VPTEELFQKCLHISNCPNKLHSIEPFCMIPLYISPISPHYLFFEFILLLYFGQLISGAFGRVVLLTVSVHCVVVSWSNKTMINTDAPRDVCSSRVVSVETPGQRQLLASSAYLNSSSQTKCSATSPPPSASSAAASPLLSLFKKR